MAFSSTSSPGSPSTPSSPHRKLRKSRPMTESRTMALARQMTVPTPQGSTTSAAASESTKSWNYALSYVGRKVSREKPTQLTSTTVVASATSTSSQAAGPPREAVQPYAAIYDYFSRPAHALLHPVSAIEHYWAVRAARAEALLGAHMVHKQELDNVSAAHEQRRSREIVDIIARHDREYAHIRRMVWIIAAVAAFAVATCSYVIFHHVSQNSPSAGRHGTVHFTIPVLSPFTSVIEHETSAVNVQLVAVLLIAPAIFGTIWLKCCTARR